jgi:hypothetical protein
MARRGKGDNGYDESKDIQLVKFKIEIDANAAWTAEFNSYDGQAPRLKLTRWYRATEGDAKGKWFYADAPERRIPYKVLVAVVEHATEIEDAYAAWEKKDRTSGRKDKKTSGESGHDDIPF